MEQWSDPDPRSGISKQNLLIAFIQKEVGSGIRCFFTPGIRDGAMVGSGSGIRDVAMVGSRISKQNLLIAFIQKEVGSGAFLPPGSGIRDKTSRIRNTGRTD
jgi:hypothetical protein